MPSTSALAGPMFGEPVREIVGVHRVAVGRRRMPAGAPRAPPPGSSERAVVTRSALPPEQELERPRAARRGSRGAASGHRKEGLELREIEHAPRARGRPPDRRGALRQLLAPGGRRERRRVEGRPAPDQRSRRPRGRWRGATTDGQALRSARRGARSRHLLEQTQHQIGAHVLIAVLMSSGTMSPPSAKGCAAVPSLPPPAGRTTRRPRAGPFVRQRFGAHPRAKETGWIDDPRDPPRTPSDESAPNRRDSGVRGTAASNARGSNPARRGTRFHPRRPRHRTPLAPRISSPASHPGSDHRLRAAGRGHSLGQSDRIGILSALFQTIKLSLSARPNLQPAATARFHASTSARRSRERAPLRHLVGAVARLGSSGS